MRMTKVAALIVGIALLLFIAMPGLSWAAEDGKALYASKCAACHKADGSGNPAMKAPALTPEMAAKVPDTIANNAKHKTAKSLTAEQVKAVAEFVKTLKK
ncbi:MAG: cytochrome c [Terriglobales bacterium]